MVEEISEDELKKHRRLHKRKLDQPKADEKARWDRALTSKEGVNLRPGIRKQDAYLTKNKKKETIQKEIV